MKLTDLAGIPSPPQGVWFLGPLPVRAYALFIITGIIVAVIWGNRRFVARGGRPGRVTDIAVFCVPFGLVGGRRGPTAASASAEREPSRCTSPATPLVADGSNPCGSTRRTTSSGYASTSSPPPCCSWRLSHSCSFAAPPAKTRPPCWAGRARDPRFRGNHLHPRCPWSRRRPCRPPEPPRQPARLRRQRGQRRIPPHVPVIPPDAAGLG
jgi:hypothetical protein